ncbi:PfkB family carbohydrate kinase [Lonsdalea quercina]|uniref:PfkB family carbohydrate kinase n=1 Tax=Lonsdalea quercina TaxID=71657 RepID=UPI0039748E00
MKKDFQATTPVVVIGAAVGDNVMTVKRLPKSGEDIEAKDLGYQIGGCAFNVARALRRLQVPVINGMTVGNGPWSQRVAAEMAALGLDVQLRSDDQDNGWCLALAEENGERTFISVSGCESQWSKEKLAQLVIPEDALIYASGYELSGEHGALLRDWLLAQPQPKLVDLGPRIADVPTAFIKALDETNVLLTLNRDETHFLCGDGDPIALSAEYAARHHLTLICRLDKDGAWLCAPGEPPRHAPIYPVDVVDTIGAGDAHSGGLLAALSAHWPLADAVDLANRVAACVVSRPGANGAPDWQELQQRFASAPAAEPHR